MTGRNKTASIYLKTLGGERSYLGRRRKDKCKRKTYLRGEFPGRGGTLLACAGTLSLPIGYKTMGGGLKKIGTGGKSITASEE